MRIPKQGFKTGVYYQVQSTRTHSNAYREINSRLKKIKIDPFYEWSGHTAIFTLAHKAKIDVESVSNAHGAGKGFLTLKDAQKALKLAREGSLNGDFDYREYNYYGAITQRNRYKFRIVKISYAIQVDIMPE